MSEEKTEEEYLRKHLSDIESKNLGKNTHSLHDTKKVSIDATTVSSLEYFAFDVKEFPCGIFYPAGSIIQVRAAEVKEIQAYSMVDDGNFYDIVEKMNDMLAACVRIKYVDGSIGSFLDIRDPDRFYLIFLIRELSFQQGTNLITKSTCTCGQEIQIELKRENFRFFPINSKIKKYFDPANRCFRFQTLSNVTFQLAPPTIGLQKSFTEYIIQENAQKRKPNMSFLKIIPFVLYDRTNISMEGITSKLDEFQQMDGMSFQFLNSAVEKLSFGIEELVKTCSCGLEVHSSMIFPDGASAVFVISDAFDKYIKE